MVGNRAVFAERIAERDRSDSHSTGKHSTQKQVEEAGAAAKRKGTSMY